MLSICTAELILISFFILLPLVYLNFKVTVVENERKTLVEIIALSNIAANKLKEDVRFTIRIS